MITTPDSFRQHPINITVKPCLLSGQLKACLPHQCAYVERKRKNPKQQNTFKNLHSAPHEGCGLFLVSRLSESITCHGICTMPNSHIFNLSKAKSFHMALLYSE